MSTFRATPGFAYYAGVQDRFNDIESRPPKPYLMNVTSDVAARSWYAARIGMAHWEAGALSLVYFVDPESKYVFAQPHPDESKTVRQNWFDQAVSALSFAEARDLSWWLELHKPYINENTPRKKLVPRLPELWREYIAGQRADCAPIPLAMPRDPDQVFASSGWTTWEDWFWEPKPMK
jgi:hypothetical protein